MFWLSHRLCIPNVTQMPIFESRLVYLSTKDMVMKIGIDIGGTNTDAVLVDNQNKIVSFCKISTTPHLEEAFVVALRTLLEQGHAQVKNIDQISIGTTHAINALLQRKGLDKVGAIRIAGHHPMTLPPAYSWPKSLREEVLVGYQTIDGGYECDGRKLTSIRQDEILRATEKLIRCGASSLAISGVFSSLFPDEELFTRRCIQEAFGKEIEVTLSHQVGSTGLIERENAALLNATLKSVMREGFDRLVMAARNCGFEGPLYMTQNNGSLISVEEAFEFPLLTLSSGPTNSFIGGSKLAGLSEALIVDIGGTSTDIGVVQNGFPRRCIKGSTIAGISLNFAMPDVLSVPLGGGSIVQFQEDQAMIGPQSVENRLFEEAISFGGSLLTLTDVAIQRGLFHHKKTCSITDLSEARSKSVIDTMIRHIHSLVSRMEGERTDMPVLCVGGGSKLIPVKCLGERFLQPPYFEVANAYGAALAEVTASHHKMISLKDKDREVESCMEIVRKKIESQGGDLSALRMIDITTVPYAYMQDHKARLSVTGAAPL